LCDSIDFVQNITVIFAQNTRNSAYTHKKTYRIWPPDPGSGRQIHLSEKKTKATKTKTKLYTQLTPHYKGVLANHDSHSSNALGIQGECAQNKF
jgi:hypothetical protein